MLANILEDNIEFRVLLRIRKSNLEESDVGTVPSWEEVRAMCAVSSFLSAEGTVPGFIR